ncbi:MAG: hypothetical protein IJ365_06275, partial [Clostridia bacterium]|nr:hypothetical protein [Clostridia bacterium]
GTEEIRNLTLSSDGTQWKSDDKYPYISTKNYDIMPADELAVGYTFAAPDTGMVRLKGEVTLPYENSAEADITASIYKGRQELWSREVTYSDSASYYYTIPLKKGEKLHFKIDSNGSNSCDWAHWTPTVEYLNIEYIAENEIYTFIENRDGIVTELIYDEAFDAYYADDEVAFISNTSVRPSAEYAVGKRYTVQIEGRHRVYGEFGTADEKMTVTVLKNREIIWEQLLPKGETGVLDVRMLAEVGDVIDIEVSAFDETPSECAVDNLYIEYHVGTAFCRASTSAGHSYDTLEEFGLGDLITNAEDTKVEFYSRRFSRKLPMTYDEKNEKWVSGIEGDTGYFTETAAYPGKHYDSVMEVTVPKNGIIRIDGDMSVRDISDGVVSKISLNDKVVWSSRIGGERPVRWDEPFDISYFSNNVCVTVKVEKGDKLAFSFNQWRLTNNDKVDISNVMLRYISGDVLSETTKWKLDNSVVVDTQNKTIQRKGISESIDVIVKTDTAYIAKDDLSKVFSSGDETSPAYVTINNKEYFPLRSIAESNGKTVVWAADKLAIIHSGIPVLFGWNELSEIDVAYSADLPQEIRGCFDTYESGTTPSISLSGSNSAIDYNAMGGLKPQKGYAEIARQSNAMVLEYAGNENKSSNTSRINISGYVDEKKSNIIGFDVFTPSPCSFDLSVLGNKGTEKLQIFLSQDGRIGLSGGLSDNTDGAEVEFGKWNNIKLILDMPNGQCHLYLNGKLVQTVEISDMECESLQIVNNSANDGMKLPLYLDNLTIGTVEAFTAEEELSDASLCGMNVTLSDTFEEDDFQDVLTSWTGDNQYRPLGGTAKIIEQSNAARIFSGKEGADTEHIRFDVREYVGDGSMPAVIEFDVNLFSDEIFIFSDRSYWGYGQQAIVSPNGYIAAAFGKWIDNAEQYASIRELAARERSEQDKKGIETADFGLNTWHNVKMLYEDNGSKRSLYIDGELVCVWTDVAQRPFDAFQITMLTNEDNQVGNALFDIDNLKITVLNRFEIGDFYTVSQNGKRKESFVPGETCYVRLSAENNNYIDESIQLVIAQYDKTNTLIDVFMPEKLLVKQGGGVLDIDYSSGDTGISFKALDNAEKIMVCAWNGKNVVKPLTEAESIFKTQQENTDS